MKIAFNGELTISIDELHEITSEEMSEAVDSALRKFHCELIMSAYSFRYSQNERIERLLKFCHTGRIEE